MVVVDLEPTHYKTDLWNAFADSGLLDLLVIYTERKNWSPDGGHDYQKFPSERFASEVLQGGGIRGAIRSAARVLRTLMHRKPDLVFICGYVHLQTIIAILYSTLMHHRFVVHADVFNNALPTGKAAWAKRLIRDALRALIFKHSSGILVCGRLGVETALEAGCPPGKILDFPYSISVERILSDAPAEVPSVCREDLGNGGPIIFFSGRMIPRKGLPDLLTALSTLQDQSWILWIEGAGPELDAYGSLAVELGLQARCRFLGFCQYDLHSWLIRSSDVVVVPSLEDTWGIVVDEGLQLGKIVISSDATGSGYDRLDHGRNGLRFPAGDADALAGVLSEVLTEEARGEAMQDQALNASKKVTPEDNLHTLMNTLRIQS